MICIHCGLPVHFTGIDIAHDQGPFFSCELALASTAGDDIIDIDSAAPWAEVWPEPATEEMAGPRE